MSRVADRYRRLCNRRGNDAWSILFGYPLARLALVWLESWKALRPTHITLASIAARAAGAWLVAFAGDGLILAVALLQLGQVLDSMDGTLARARGQHSALGAFLDRAGDALALGLLCAAVGWRAAGAPWMAAALGGGFLHLLRGYMHWAARGLGAPVDGSIDGGRPPGDAAVLGLLCAAVGWRAGGAAWMAAALGGGFLHLLRGYMHWAARGLAPCDAGERIDGARPDGEEPRPLREWLAGLPRLVLFNEADLYLWISIGALTGRWAELCALLLVTQVAAALGLAVHHAARLSGGAAAGGRRGSGPWRP